MQAQQHGKSRHNHELLKLLAALASGSGQAKSPWKGAACELMTVSPSPSPSGLNILWPGLAASTLTKSALPQSALECLMVINHQQDSEHWRSCLVGSQLRGNGLFPGNLLTGSSWEE